MLGMIRVRGKIGDQRYGVSRKTPLCAETHTSKAEEPLHSHPFGALNPTVGWNFCAYWMKDNDPDSLHGLENLVSGENGRGNKKRGSWPIPPSP